MDLHRIPSRRDFLKMAAGTGLTEGRWTELELTMIYTRTFERTRTSLFPYSSTRDANRVGFQVQWNY